MPLKIPLRSEKSILEFSELWNEVSRDLITIYELSINSQVNDIKVKHLVRCPL